MISHPCSSDLTSRLDKFSWQNIRPDYFCKLLYQVTCLWRQERKLDQVTCSSHLTSSSTDFNTFTPLYNICSSDLMTCQATWASHLATGSSHLLKLSRDLIKKIANLTSRLVKKTCQVWEGLKSRTFIIVEYKPCKKLRNLKWQSFERFLVYIWSNCAVYPCIQYCICFFNGNFY